MSQITATILPGDRVMTDDGVPLHNLKNFFDDSVLQFNLAENLLSGVQTVTGSEAIDVTNGMTEIITAGVEGFVLPDGQIGQKKTLFMVDHGGDATITPDNFQNGTSITLGANGQFIVLLFSTFGGWNVETNVGATVNP